MKLLLRLLGGRPAFWPRFLEQLPRIAVLLKLIDDMIGDSVTLVLGQGLLENSCCALST